MTLNDAQFKALHKKLKTEGGFSANSRTGKAPQVGYMVSIPGHEMQIRSENVAPAHIKEFVEKHGAELAGKDKYIGGWENDGEVSLDVSQNVKPDPVVSKQFGNDVALADARTSTLDLSIARNQEAAYDLQTGSDLPNPHFDPTGRRLSR